MLSSRSSLCGPLWHRMSDIMMIARCPAARAHDCVCATVILQEQWTREWRGITHLQACTVSCLNFACDTSVAGHMVPN